MISTWNTSDGDPGKATGVRKSYQVLISDWGNCVKEGVATLACVPIVLQNLINALILLGGVICVFLIIYAGIKYITSEGDPEKVATARKTLMYAIGGFLVVLASFLIINFIAQFTGATRLAPTP